MPRNVLEYAYKNDYVSKAAQSQLNSVRERLRLWGLTAKQIAHMEKSSRPADHITLYSPMSGVVIHKNALEGMYVNTGTKIFTISDLSKVWVKMDAYESDVAWLRYGQEVEFRTEAFPGEVFKGRIAFIDPVLNQQTRTIKIGRTSYHLSFSLDRPFLGGRRRYTRVQISAALVARWVMG